MFTNCESISTLSLFQQENLTDSDHHNIMIYIFGSSMTYNSTEVLHTPSSTRLGFELMTSRS